MTDNHNYNTPSKGTVDWDVPLNENTERFDTDIEVRDTEANIDQYTPKNGAKFFATDTENVFVGDGSQWRPLQSTGRSPSLQSARVKDIVNDIGDAKLQAPWDGLIVPVSQGLGMSDAIDPDATSTPVQDAIDAINNGGSGEGTIFFPPRNIDSPGNLSGWDHIRFVGWSTGQYHSSSKISRTDPSNPMFVHAGEIEAYIDGIEFVGNKTDGEQPWLHITSDGQPLRQFNIGDVNIRNFYCTTTGVIYMEDQMYRCHWNFLRMKNVKKAYYTASGSGGYENTVTNWHIEHSSLDPVLGTDYGGTGFSILHLSIGGTVGDTIIEFGGIEWVLNDLKVECPHGASKPTLFEFNRSGNARINNVHILEPIGTVVRTRSGTTVGQINTSFNGSYDVAVDVYDGNPAQPVFYEGPASEMTNSGGSTAEMVWSLQDSKVIDPRASGTVTVSSGGTGRVQGVASNERTRPRLQMLSPSSSGQTGSDYAVDPYFRWNDSAGEWDLVVEWRTDPGTNVNFDYEVVTE